MKHHAARSALLWILTGAVVLSCTACRTQQAAATRRTAAYGPQTGNVQIIAHRGGALRAPENTLAALEQAIASGADMAELDLRMTADGVVVALHDESLARTTGLDRMVSDTDFKIIRTLDAGSRFSPDYENEPVPTLPQLLRAAKGHIRLMLELKDTPDNFALLDRVVAQIRAADMTDQCLIASMSTQLLQQSKSLAPELKTVYIGKNTWPELWTLPYTDGYSIALSSLTQEDISSAHRAGRSIYTWTTNERWQIARALSLGADGLVSDDPALGRKL